MKLAVTAKGVELHSPIDPRFGRATYFFVVDTETEETHATDNTMNLNAAHGAGIQAGKKIIELGAETVITGQVGPKAFATLQAGGIDIFTGATGTVAEAIEQFKSGNLTLTESATHTP
ncbi:MAG: NifB/NifX family molybdenum-iron cluster-binding protein [Phycisphaerales bacterium]|nr:NifB/NifX family molybdenum-iron cluster-binding protein [Phycisphaerales bacterium]